MVIHPPNQIPSLLKQMSVKKGRMLKLKKLNKIEAYSNLNFIKSDNFRVVFHKI